MNGELEAQHDAQAVRQRHGLGIVPIPDMVTFVSDHAGCDVTVIAMPDGVDGVIARDPDTDRAYIAVRADDQWARQRMTLAHELGHLLADDLARELPADCATDAASESAANTFGRHLLAPQAGVSALLQGHGARRGELDESHLSLVVHHFRVSPQVASIQMRESGWISPEQDAAWRGATALTTRRLATRYGWGAEHDQWAADAGVERPPTRLLRRVIEAYVSGRASVAAVAVVAGKSESATLAWLASEGVAPEPSSVEVIPFDFDDVDA